MTNYIQLTLEFLATAEYKKYLKDFFKKSVIYKTFKNANTNYRTNKLQKLYLDLLATKKISKNLWLLFKKLLEEHTVLIDINLANNNIYLNLINMTFNGSIFYKINKHGQILKTKFI